MALDLARYRGALPPIVYALSVTGPANAPAAVTANRGKSFLVADAGDLDPVFIAAGAVNGSVGWVNTDAYGAPYLFRASEKGDVVVWGENGSLLRYEDVRRPDPATSESIIERKWIGYRSQPQRALDGTTVFELFDPAGVYDYFATLAGSVLAQLHASNRAILTLRDPLTIPAEYLELAAASLNVEFDPTDSDDIRRTKVISAIPASRIRGTESAISLRIRQLGMSGYITESWRAQDSTDWDIIHGDQPRFQQASLKFKDGLNPAAGQFVTIQVRVEPANVSPMAAPVQFMFVSGVAVAPQVALGVTAYETLENLVQTINTYVGTAAHVRAGTYRDNVPHLLLQSTYDYTGSASPVLYAAGSTTALSVTLSSPPTNARARLSAEIGWPAIHVARRANDDQLTISAYRADGSNLFPYISSAVTPGTAFRRSRGAIVLYNNYVPKPDDIVAITSGGTLREFRYAPTSALLTGQVDWPAVSTTADDFVDSHTANDELLMLITAEFGSLSVDADTSPFTYDLLAGSGEDGVPIADPNATWIDVLHGDRADEPVSHVPTSLITVHLNQLDGQPLTLDAVPDPGVEAGTAGPLPEMDAVRFKVVRDLAHDVLPVNTRIRQWVTDIIVPDVNGDLVATTDLLSVTRGVTLISQSS